jgi:putative hydrolase of HD superfamily
MPMTEPRPTPIGDVTDAELDETVKLAFEWGHLKLVPRTGWLRAGIERPESVAEHSLRAAMLAWAIAALEGADPDRAATLALFHDSQETRTGDVDYVGRSYLRPASNQRITADQAEPFIDTAIASLRTPSGRRLAEAAMRADPAAWWRSFQPPAANNDPGDSGKR